MMEDTFSEYTIRAYPVKMYNGRFSVKASVSRMTEAGLRTAEFSAEDKIWYILEVEAVKESINLGKNLIKNNLVGF